MCFLDHGVNLKENGEQSPMTDDLKSINSSNDDVEQKRRPKYVAERDLQEPHLKVGMKFTTT